MTDGVTVGHPCCNEPDCKVPLDKVENEYCRQHERLSAECCINGCLGLREAGHRTCSLPQHRAAESARKESRRRRASNRQAPYDTTTRPVKKATLKGVFSRKWTHNEQLMVRPCGVVIGRATFYNAESMSGVKVSECHQQSTFLTFYQMFVKSIFPERLPGMLPTFLFYDNACGLRSHIRCSGDDHLLRHMALVVDPFHFSGHSEQDTECQAHCNPHKFPILKTFDGSWLFNSSVAEQVNVWYGKFQPKVKEMNVVRLVPDFASTPFPDQLLIHPPVTTSFLMRF